MRIALLLIGIVLTGCVGRQQVIAVHPDKEPMCGWVKAWTHCCVLESGPNLIVRCEEFERREGERRKPKEDNPKRDA
jgi:hypothetical protein